jgi:hypothetical protein
MRTNPNQTKQPNPAERFFEWKAKEGKFVYYDKALKETFDGPKKFIFMVLDELSTIKGQHKREKKPIYSNEVRDIRKEPLVVHVHDRDDLAKGLYEDIKDRIAANGGKFCKSVYIAFKNDKGVLSLGNIQFTGTAMSSWFAFTKNHGNKIYQKAVFLSGKHEEEGELGTYMAPEFQLHDISPETEEEATVLQKALSEYLVDYLGQDHSASPATNTEKEANTKFMDNASKKQDNAIKAQDEPEPIGDPDDDLPF